MVEFKAALDLMRRLPPRDIEKNLGNTLALAPELVEDLLSAVDQVLPDTFGATLRTGFKSHHTDIFQYLSDCQKKKSDRPHLVFFCSPRLWIFSERLEHSFCDCVALWINFCKDKHN